MDLVLSRLIGLVPRGLRDRVREVRLRGGVKIRYRLNKGDLHSIREIWFQEAYRLPFEDSSGVLLDLGANIGMASLWLATNYSFTRVITVEPDPNNATLVR
jgi:predicted RNA methylase